MVVLMVILTIVLGISVDYVIQRRKQIGLASSPALGVSPISSTLSLLPKGIFLQPSMTWTKILDDGEIAVGIHPILMGVVGEPDAIELHEPGLQIAKGEGLINIRKGNHSLVLKSPVVGQIMAINSSVVEHPTWESLSKNWLFVLKPEQIANEIPQWQFAEKAETWTKTKLQQLKNFFAEQVPDNGLGLTLADGGDIPVGVLAHFDEDVWKKFETEFCETGS